MIEACFENLSHALRLYGEHIFRFKELMTVDRDEAVGNLDLGFNGIINAFHSLYDANRKSNGLNWYRYDEFLVIAIIRNARHHNNANKIRQLFNLHRPELEKTERLLLIQPEPGEEDGFCSEYYINLADLEGLLLQPKSKNKLPANTKQRVHNYLNWDKIQEITKDQDIDFNNVFYNAIPLVINAGIVVFPDIKKEISGKSTESCVFKSLFEHNQPFKLDSLSFDIT
ncbi:MAG: hypothetical protein WCS17_08915 [Prevotella sp.]